MVGALHIMPPVPRWHRGRMVLVGDAVHAPSNSTGQGASLAIESAIELARCLRDLPDPQSAFDAYETLRRSRVERIAKRGAKINHSKAPGRVARMFMPLALPLMFKLMDVEKTISAEQRYAIDWEARASAAIRASERLDVRAWRSETRGSRLACARASNLDNRDMALVTLLDVHLGFGDRPLLDGAGFAVQANERIGLIGRNGTGKSTLLRIIAGRIQPDDGALQVRDGLRIGFVEQETELAPAPTIGESLAAGIPGDRWTFQARLNEYMDRLDLAPSRPLDTASGGERKRAALARALALDPELLLLDEPTNHLDIAGIERLEELLTKVRACIVMTHDRAFLDRVATRIVELDRGVLRSYPGNFGAYEARKNDELAAEEVANRRFDKFWAQEEVWIRKGVEARRTRNEGRVKRLERLRLERAERRDRLGNINLTMDAGQNSGRLVAELVDVTKGFGDRADRRRNCRCASCAAIASGSSARTAPASRRSSASFSARSPRIPAACGSARTCK